MRYPITIHTRCPSCDSQLNVKEELAGKSGKCPKCGATVEIPKPIPPATEKQKEFARELGIEFPDDIDRRKISALIDEALAEQNDKRFSELNEIKNKESEAYQKIRSEVIADIDKDNPRIADATPNQMVNALEEKELAAILITYDEGQIGDDQTEANIVFGDNLDEGEMKRVLMMLGTHFIRNS